MNKSLLIAIAVFFVIIFSLNIISAVDIHFIRPQLGDVDEENRYPQVGSFCNVDWECTAWGKCVDGTKKRICIENNNCQFKYNKPLTQISCRENSVIEAPNVENQWFLFGMIFVVLLIIILIIITGLI